MKINRNNYELYFMDYLDGNLTDIEIQMLEDFLLINPELRAELEGTEKISLSPEEIIFNNKEFLKKPDLSLPVNVNNFEDFCIAGSEGDLNVQQQSGLANYTKIHPETEELLKLYNQLHLSPDKNIVFPGKGKLKKTLILIPGKILFPVLSAAAAVAIMFIIYLRSEDISKITPGIATGFPEAIIVTPDTSTQQLNIEKPAFQNRQPAINQAAIIAFSTPKEKKQAPSIKTDASHGKNNDDYKSKDVLPPQKLNPSFHIKLPSVADNQIYVPAIEGGKITYSKVKAKSNPPEYLSLSEYARKQLSEKVLGNKERENTRITAWEVADAGISGINKLTGGEMKLEKKTDEYGRLTAYSFNSKLLSISTTALK